MRLPVFFARAKNIVFRFLVAGVSFSTPHFPALGGLRMVTVFDILVLCSLL